MFLNSNIIFTKISDLENKILEVNEKNKKLIFLHDEFKKKKTKIYLTIM